MLRSHSPTSLPALHACSMACGIPTIVPDKGAHAEFIPDGAAFLVKSKLTNCTASE